MNEAKRPTKTHPLIVTKCVAARALNASRPPSSESAVDVVDLIARTEKKKKIERVKPMKIII